MCSAVCNFLPLTARTRRHEPTAQLARLHDTLFDKLAQRWGCWSVTRVRRPPIPPADTTNTLSLHYAQLERSSKCLRDAGKCVGRRSVPSRSLPDGSSSGGSQHTSPVGLISTDNQHHTLLAPQQRAPAATDSVHVHPPLVLVLGASAAAGTPPPPTILTNESPGGGTVAAVAARLLQQQQQHQILTLRHANSTAAAAAAASGAGGVSCIHGVSRPRSL